MEVIHGDCLDVMRGMESGSVDLVFCSPPYEAARTYGIDFKLRGQDWVDWCVERWVECDRICKGLVAWVVEGQTRKFQWSAAPALLMADLHRRGIKLRKPPVFHRVGIPGSGGPDWLRNDWEFIVCSSKGKLPWSENTACGHPPKWAPGGEMSYRVTDGTRRNQWGHSGKGKKAKRADGSVDSADRPSHVVKSKAELLIEANGAEQKVAERLSANCETGRTHIKTNPDGTERVQYYDPPAKANPGNVIKSFSASEIFMDVLRYGYASCGRPGEVLQSMRKAIAQEAIQEWAVGVISGLASTEVLRPEMHGHWRAYVARDIVRSVREVIQTSDSWEEILQSHLRSCSSCECSSRSAGARQNCSQENCCEGEMRSVWSGEGPGSSPSGREPDQQSPEQSPSVMQNMSREPSQSTCSVASEMRDLWSRSIEELQGIWDSLRQALQKIQEVWRSANESSWLASLSSCCESSDVIKSIVGGGVMGNRLCHLNEAPFPENLAKFFILSFCPPGGVVLDPFSGSGTTAAVAIRHGRRAIAIDIRESQVELTSRRVSVSAP